MGQSVQPSVIDSYTPSSSYSLPTHPSNAATSFLELQQWLLVLQFAYLVLFGFEQVSCWIDLVRVLVELELEVRV